MYWEDTDAGGVVFYANYLKFFERARTEWLRSAGLLAAAHAASTTGVMFVVSRHGAALPARRRGSTTCSRSRCSVPQAGRASLRIAQQAWRGDELLAEGEIRIGCVGAAPGEDFRPCRIPAAILDKHRMNQDLSIFTLVLHASFVVQLVMAGLLVVSLASWTVIFGKVFGLKRVRAAQRRASSASSGRAAT